jgi:hypothetical protein
MSIKVDPHLSLVVGGQSVGANLESAIEAGDVTEN